MRLTSVSVTGAERVRHQHPAEGLGQQHPAPLRVGQRAAQVSDLQSKRCWQVVLNPEPSFGIKTVGAKSDVAPRPSPLAPRALVDPASVAVAGERSGEQASAADAFMRPLQVCGGGF